MPGQARRHRKTRRPSPSKKKEKLLPLDFSILKDFRFVHGSGDYQDKEVCAMTALNLVVRIAKGEITLDDAISPRGYGSINENDTVSCVSPVLNQLVIFRNDSMVDEDERKEWAMAILPTLVGTNLGIPFERKLRAMKEMLFEEFKTAMAKEQLAKFDAMKGSREQISLLQEVVDMLESSSEEFDGDDPNDIPFIDGMIDKVKSAIDAEKQRRAARKTPSAGDTSL